MSGVTVIRHLLTNAVAITAIVPAARIIAGDLPLNTTLPAIAITSISSMPMNSIRNRGRDLPQIERVQVNALAKNYEVVKQLLALILVACPSQRGSVGGVDVIDITPDFQGPDLFDERLPLYSQSRDFLVRWSAPTT